MTSRQCGAGPGLRRRRAASYRCEPLASGHRDPFQPWRPERCSSKQVDGVVDAAEYLRDIGYPPLFDLPMLRSLWRAGHHHLVAHIAERWEMTP